ncbi:MAG: coproporphyrinogen III oxidase [Demequinaceae bacterium]|nr:coproporphyrinogen III oxidase [Demequinaceae bacterium]
MAFGVYVHVPFCATRCGYCDFVTYALGEWGGATLEGYVEAALGEIGLARRVLGGGSQVNTVSHVDTVSQANPVFHVDTVFFGGGTPTMLRPEALVRLLDGIRDAWGLADDAEVTAEANPDSVTGETLARLAGAGFTRVSLGMQSAVGSVLATLDRTHGPENVTRAVEGARAAGLDVSLDLIYGTPGEGLSEWRETVAAALVLAPDHVSAYSLVIEPATRMGAALARGEIAPVDPDLQAEMYEAADEAFASAGYDWYEVSNWAREGHRCRHNLGYWTGGDWWGVGPGAHSHLGAGEGRPATRWWNVKHPLEYGERIASGASPEEGREALSGEQSRIEAVMLGVRLREGLDAAALPEAARDALPALAGDGLIDEAALGEGRLVLTRRGRLLADVVVRALT